MTLDKQVAAKLAFEPGDKKVLDEIWLGVGKTFWAAWKNDRVFRSYDAARASFLQAYLDHGIKGPLATTALAAVGL